MYVSAWSSIGHEPGKGIMRKRVDTEGGQGRETTEGSEGHVVGTNGVYWGAEGDPLEEMGTGRGKQRAPTKQSISPHANLKTNKYPP